MGGGVGRSTITRGDRGVQAKPMRPDNAGEIREVHTTSPSLGKIMVVTAGTQIRGAAT